MRSVLEFGQQIDAYDVRVLDERAVRASAGVLFFPAEAERGKVPDFAKALGHEEKWKLQNNCR